MGELFGATMPEIQLTGFLSSTWLWVALVLVIGLILIGFLSIYLYFKTWNKRIEFYENISGSGYQRIATRRARTIRLGNGGDEVLKPRGFNGYLTPYGRKIGKNTYMFCKGEDGYWYNAIFGDFEGKQNMLDIEPVDRDVRMFHVAMDRITQNQYGEKKNFMEKHGSMILTIVFLIILILGMWFIIGKIGDATQALSETAKTNEEVAKAWRTAISTPPQGGSGLVSADDDGST